MRNKQNDIYFLLKDILSCFPANVECNLSRTLNQHLIAKEIIREILRDEIRQKKPNFKILAGALVIQNSFIMQLPKSAVYELINILPELKYCLNKDPRKTIQKLSKEIILRLFLTLYKEFIMLPNEMGIKYLGKFKDQFNKEVINSILIDKNNGLSLRFIFQEHGFIFDGQPIDETNSKIRSILNKFYS